MIIYKVIFPNGKFYIGRTIYNINKRKREHKKDSKYKNSVFYKAIRKYGWDNLQWEIIDTAETEEELNFKEQFWIKYYNTYIGFKNPNGYNMTLGGEGISGFIVDKETREKISKSRKGKCCGEDNHNFNKHLSEETRNKISKSKKGKLIGKDNPNYGVTPSKETREKMSKAKKGKYTGSLNHRYRVKPSRETREKMRNAKLNKYNGENNPMFGKVHSEETKKKISKANSGENNPNYGKHRSEITKQKISNANKGENNPMYGKTHSKESKEKMSISRRGNNSKITEEIAKEIKIKLYNGENTKNICDEFNVTRNIVSKIKMLETFKYILPEYNEKIKNSINIKTKITEEIAKEIKIKLVNDEKNIDIVNELNVTKNHVGKIKNLRTWKYVLPELNEILKEMYKK